MIFMWKGAWWKGDYFAWAGDLFAGALYITIASYIFMRNHLKFYSAPTAVRPAVHSIKIQEASRSHIPLCNYLTANIPFFPRATKTFQDNLEPSFASDWIEQLFFFPTVQVLHPTDVPTPFYDR